MPVWVLWKLIGGINILCIHFTLSPRYVQFWVWLLTKYFKWFQIFSTSGIPQSPLASLSHSCLLKRSLLMVSTPYTLSQCEGLSHRYFSRRLMRNLLARFEVFSKNLVQKMTSMYFFISLALRWGKMMLERWKYFKNFLCRNNFIVCSKLLFFLMGK